jgi:predicted nucleic acid-binding Zn ribbon protein
MEPPIDQRICHACGEIYFTLLQQFENEITAKCNNCEAKVTFSSAKDLTITEG